MSDTPRTDKEAGAFVVVSISFARQLERELADERKAYLLLLNHHHEVLDTKRHRAPSDQLGEALREVAALRERIEALEKWRDSGFSFAVRD